MPKVTLGRRRRGTKWSLLALRLSLFSRDGGRCHIWPAALGGETSEENTRLECRRCNEGHGMLPCL